MENERVCDNCGRWIDERETRYEMRVDIMAEAADGIDLTDQAAGDPADDLRSLLEKMERMNDEEVQEATDQVHESYCFSLCPECREQLHRRLRARTGILGGD